MDDNQFKGKLTNCYIVSPVGRANPMFVVRKDGTVVADLDQMLICPLGMFSPRQIEMAVKKYRRTKDANDG